VRAPLGMVRLVEQIAAQLANIDDHGCAMVGDIVPILRGGKFAPQYHRCAAEQGAALTNEPAGHMIEGQGDVNAILRCQRTGRNGDAKAAPGAGMGDARCLGQAGGAGCIDIEEQVMAGQMGAVALVGAVIGQFGEGAIQILPDFSVPVPQHW